MSNVVDLAIDGRGAVEAGDRMTRRYLSLGTASVASTTKWLERALETETQRAVPGRLWRAWASDSFPRSGPARDPAGVVFIKGGARTRAAMKFWTEPGEVRGREGQPVAIPLPAAGPIPRGGILTPEMWEQRTGITLRPVYRPGRAPLLVADGAVLSGRAQRARANTPRRIAAGRGSATVPIFVLLPFVRFRNAFAIAPIVGAAERELARDYLARIGRGE